MLSYAMLSILSSWFIICNVSLQSFTANAGILLCPISLLTANVIAEIYGYKNARRAIWCGFFFNLLSFSYALLIINLPSPSYALHNPLFNSIIITYLKTSFFFILSHLIAESLNIFFLAKLKLKLNGYYLKLRLLVCVLLSLLINNTILFFAKYISSPIHLQFFPTLLIDILITLPILPVICFFIEKVKKLELFAYLQYSVPC
ncbi:MAG: VUT family protein [Gammaproteobacteria bacterium]|nr:MAG: VUT family protein [Gammaproteobacteria bacterium]